jgi:hypothetical protein
MANNLIFSRRADNGIMGTEEILRKAPAVFTAGHAEGLSSRYGEVSTAKAISILADCGWHPTQAAQKRSRTLAGQSYAEHMISFAKPGLDFLNGDNDRPEIILYNSHNGSSSLRLFAGLYRFICSNGIVAGQGFESRLRHTSGSVRGFEQLLYDTAEMLPGMIHTVELLRSIRPSPATVQEMAKRAGSLRWEWSDFGEPDLKPGVYFNRYTTWDLINARRYGDSGMDAWTVFNRMQENLIRGGIMIQSVTESNPYGKLRAARPIGSVSENIRVNRALWDMTLEMAEIEPATV